MQLTQLNQSTTHAPRWSPAGEQIAFMSQTDGQADVYVIDASGGVPKRISTGATHEVWPSWSVDGGHLYYASDQSGSWQIWKQAVTDGEAEQVTREGGYKSQVSGDGATLFFSKPDSTGIWRLDLLTGAEQKVVDADAFHWDVTDQALYFVTQKERIIHFEVNRLDLETDAIREVTTLTTLPMASFSRWGFAVSKNESWIVYAQVDKAESDVMLMEPFE
jgi:Tol biopolymer transport system component